MSWDLDNAHEACKGNRPVLEASETCACFCCQRVFPPAEIDKWIERKKGTTATCPYCFVDAILASESGWPIDEPAFLKAMHKRWFGTPIKLTRAELKARLADQEEGRSDDR